MSDEIKEIFPKDFYIDKNGKMVAEITLKNLNKIIDYITNLQQRIDKAIEYIKDNITWYYDEDLDESVYQDEVSGDKILNILKGDSNE